MQQYIHGLGDIGNTMSYSDIQLVLDVLSPDTMHNYALLACRMRTVCRRCREDAQRNIRRVKVLDFGDMRLMHNICRDSFRDFMQSLPEHTRIHTLRTGDCVALNEFHDYTFMDGRLSRLRVLDLKNCSNLRTLDYDISVISTLEVLDISGTRIERIEIGFFRNFARLTTLNTSCCEYLEYLTPGFTQSTSLEHLDISYCNEVQSSLSDAQIHTLANLTYMDIRSVPVSEEWTPHITQVLTRLHTLKYTQADTNTYTLERLTNLTKLCIDSFHVASLENGFISLTNLTKLSVCTYTGAPAAVECISKLSRLLKLSLYIHDDSHEGTVVSLKELASLQHLKLALSNKLYMGQCMQALPMLANLQHLHVFTDDTCFAIDPRKRATKLTLDGLEHQELQFDIGTLTTLTELTIHNCNHLERLPNTIGNLQSLTAFHLTSCSRVKVLPQSFYLLTSLTSLDFFGSDNLRLSRCVSLLENLESVTTSHSEESRLNHLLPGFGFVP